MNALNFLDANVWLALLWQSHIHAERAQQWFQRVADEQFLFCRFTQITTLRLLTTAAIMGRDVCTMVEAWKLWDIVESDRHVSFLPEPDGLDQEFREHSKVSAHSPKVWADAYLLAFASVAGVKLVTFDRALAMRKVEVLIL
jgi:uncharacterized protein